MRPNNIFFVIHLDASSDPRRLRILVMNAAMESAQ